MASTVPSVRIVKSAAYKGGLRLFSNRYHFNGGTPSDATHWHTLFDAIVLVEKTIYTGLTTIVQAVGYAAGSEVPVASKVYSTVGTVSGATGAREQALPVAALARWSTAAVSTKNHPIYCFNYFHGVLTLDSFAGFDKLDANQKTAMQTYASDWITGFTDGVITAVRATPTGHSATGSLIEEYVTHRDFPYQSSV